MTPASRYSFFRQQGEHTFMYLPSWSSTDCTYWIGDSYGKKLTGSYKTIDIEIFKEHCEPESTVYPIEPNTAVEHTINKFFDWTGGETVELGISCDLQGKPHENADDNVETIAKYLAGRPIKVTMYREDVTRSDDPHKPLNEFFRDYIDFKMYATNACDIPDNCHITISEKLLNCEFLYLTLPITNSEVLLEKFKGWGLVVRIQDPRLNFEFFNSVVQKWLSGEDTHWEYLALNLTVPYNSWKHLISLGKEIILEKDGGANKELQITRTDGRFCRIGNLPSEESELDWRMIYFYVGECSDGMFHFHSMGCDLM